jgi:transcriptional regulator with XRE-family HTH domain
MSESTERFLGERETTIAVLAKNLALARAARGITQDMLAEASGVSRATIAQIESGDSDPRLSTIVALAASLGVSALILLLSEREIAALAELVQDASRVNQISADISPDDIDGMRRLIQSGLQKRHRRAAKIGISAAQNAGFTAPGSSIGAAIGTLLLPGIGTVIGAVLGGLIQITSRDAASKESRRTRR